MDYEQKYKEALEKARQLCAYPTTKPFISDLQDLFPELAESDDERIRKGIIRNLEYLADRAEGFVKDELKERIAWLEKQGESDETKAKIFLINNGYPIDSNGKFPTYEEMYYIIKDGLEKQGEQNPTNEPKFKVGDWVVFNNKHQSIYQVEKIEDGYYILRHTHGGTFRVCMLHDESLRLWTIQDAKDGDVLCSGQIIVIFKHFEDPSYRQHIVAYIGLDTSGNVQITDGTWNLGIDKAKPATKEQRATLMKAMTDAGYTFDFEKKELKKIEPTDKYEGLTDFERTLADICVGWIGEELGWKQYIKDNADVLLKIAIKKFNSVQDAPFEQKPAWSEEDEKMLKVAIESCEQCGNEYAYYWLKSIEDRVQHQPRQEWKQENTGDLTDFENAMMHIGGSFFGQHAGLDPNDTNAIKEQANLLLELVPKPVETFTTNKIE